MPLRRYTVYCDESLAKGELFSNFYGGSVIQTPKQQELSGRLSEKKAELGLFNELKWTKISASYAHKYIEFIDEYFDLIESGDIKVRIMFTQNSLIPTGLTSEHHDKKYFLLYYQLIKHAFGFIHCNELDAEGAIVHLLLDDLPDTKEKVEEFRKHLSNLTNTESYFGKNIRFPIDQIAGVDSKKHVILQGLDIILGSMQFRLNQLHKTKPEGKKRRGARTIAKEKVYKHINSRIRGIYPRFNIGATTGTKNGLTDYWAHPYRHWLFRSANSVRAGRK